ncbi:hypothetical protein RN001_011596 [Aquatica leii]|uniref:Uncharacterized protein n=1 Tax=Aquatica leii TaxID=1421715 RepID=A0AAN7SEN1_9COLE|nr:hypothetical protein RN001_011596 [Aquatica leii]
MAARSPWYDSMIAQSLNMNNISNSPEQDDDLTLEILEKRIQEVLMGMGAAVVTVLYFTPVPDSSFLDCSRPCHDLDWPMICRVKLTIENYKTLQKYHWYSNNCSMQDEIATSILTVNHQLPGPSIQVCQNDVLIIDVINKIPGQSVTIHWRGQPQTEAPMMDGVPMVTQCPISSYTTFQYKFRASASGTHLWHAHAGAKFSDGVFGAFIVKEPKKKSPLKNLYDFDEKQHVVMISEKNFEFDNSRSLLINGKNVGEEIAFIVSWGRRYRFRMMYSGGSISCPITVSVEKHLLNVISLDGNSIRPYEVNSVSFSKGERVDFVIKADQTKSSYAFKVTSECYNSVIKTQALVKYDDSVDEANNRDEQLNKILSKDKLLDTATCESKSNKVCVGSVESLSDIPNVLINNVDTTLFLGFDSKVVYQTNDTGSEELSHRIYRMNNITFTYPSSPLLTQREDVLRSSMCNSLNKPSICDKSDICECVHIEKIPLGSKVELIFVDLGGDFLETVFHLHGYKFYIVGYKNFKKPVTINYLKQLDKNGNLFKRNFNKPVLKDTLRIPRHGVVAVRFIADNPGYWMLRDEHALQWTRGLDMVLQVGNSCDTVATPKNFPMCGSWTEGLPKLVSEDPALENDLQTLLVSPLDASILTDMLPVDKPKEVSATSNDSNTALATTSRPDRVEQVTRNICFTQKTICSKVFYNVLPYSKKKEYTPSVITSDKWVEYQEECEKLKMEKEGEKQERKQARESKKQMMAKKRRKT